MPNSRGGSRAGSASYNAPGAGGDSNGVPGGMVRDASASRGLPPASSTQSQAAMAGDNSVGLPPKRKESIGSVSVGSQGTGGGGARRRRALNLNEVRKLALDVL